MIKTKQDLLRDLRSIDHRGYPAYKALKGVYDFGSYVLHIVHVQGDPFASPSDLMITVKGSAARWPQQACSQYETRVALQDMILRRFSHRLSAVSGKAGGSGKSGRMSASRPGQEILDRSACQLGADGALTLRFYAGFPAAGRTVLAGELEKMLFQYLPDVVQGTAFANAWDGGQIQSVMDLAEDQMFLRAELERRSLCAFVADGSILPRESGISQRPLREAIPFRSPEEDRITIDLPHHGPIQGMAIRKGITLIIGGGYHGKSTLLKALERGVYNHIAGDGREYVVTAENAVKIRAEDGRCVSRDDISLFINHLPDEKDTTCFSTENASGSTSQAASVVEAIECGAKTLLMDEDTCATNFMVRDELMQKIVSGDEEPITPFSDRMRELYEKKGISTILVAGSSGAFFREADTVIQMDRYEPKDVTEKVRALVPFHGMGAHSASERAGTGGSVIANNSISTGGSVITDNSISTGGSVITDDSSGTGEGVKMPDQSRRCPRPGSDFQEQRGRIKHKNLGTEGFLIGHGQTDLRLVEQLVDPEQSECLAQTFLILAKQAMNGRNTVGEIVRDWERQFRAEGFQMYAQNGAISGSMAKPRKEELEAALSRCRGLRW
ncbi:MAG: ABC-ATPase domain-containing protein [Eubacterium sp.]|nr:ABC-ATPase domain-containing protein [Eubacterium sp.]